MNSSLRLFFIVSLGWCFLFFGCKSFKKQKEKLPDTPERGSIYVSADESFRPVVEQLATVYESNHQGVKINVIYKPEAECFRDFGVDSIRMIITTRVHTEEERDFMIDSMNVSPES